MKKYFLILIIMAHFSGCSIQKAQNPAKFTKITIGTQSFDAEIADNSQSRQRGLMFREKLNADEGMLFVFENEGIHSFWMKNTFIPLDIVWISKDKKIVDINSMDPCIIEDCPSYIPKNASKYVLEVAAGKFRGKLGDSVDF